MGDDDEPQDAVELKIVDGPGADELVDALKKGRHEDATVTFYVANSDEDRVYPMLAWINGLERLDKFETSIFIFHADVPAIGVERQSAVGVGYYNTIERVGKMIL